MNLRGSFLGAVILLALSAFRNALGAELDPPPFQIPPPTVDWHVDYSTNRPMGNGVFLVATGRNAKTGVTSLVLKTILNKPSPSALDEMCQGIRDSFTNPVVKKSTDEDVKFLNFSARRFVYTVTQSGRSTYNEAIVFVADGIRLGDLHGRASTAGGRRETNSGNVQGKVAVTP